MNTAPTCTAEVLVIAGARHPRRRYGRQRSPSDLACHDCGVAPGGTHHLGCDMEECPACGWQLLSCGCGDDPDTEESHLHAVAE
ncbi:MAG: hypothetical protein ACR2KP_08430 [Egibacteraceae bacterium]